MTLVFLGLVNDIPRAVITCGTRPTAESQLWGYPLPTLLSLVSYCLSRSDLPHDVQLFFVCFAYFSFYEMTSGPLCSLGDTNFVSLTNLALMQEMQGRVEELP